MKKNNFLRLSLLFFSTFFLHGNFEVFACKKIMLESHRQTLSSDVYNMRGAELFYCSKSDTIFIEKRDAFCFYVSDSLEYKISFDSIKKVSFMLVNANYKIHFFIPKDIFTKYYDFYIAFLENKKYGIRMDLGLGYFGTVITDVIVKPNRLWKPKYYSTPSWLH